MKRFACAKLVTEHIIDRNQNFGLDSAGLTSIGIKPTLTIPNVLQISLLPLCTPLLGRYLRELANSSICSQYDALKEVHLSILLFLVIFNDLS